MMKYSKLGARQFIFVLLGWIAVMSSGWATTESINIEGQQMTTDLEQVIIITNLGEITLDLNPEHAPETVANFITYANDGFYDGTIFHRVISGFMIQGGGFTEDMSQKDTRDSIKNEANNGLKNIRGSIAMARTSDPESATAQFFINLTDNDFLDFKSETTQGWGYAVFGQVVNGMDVVDEIAAQSTGAADVPVTPVIIESIRVSNDAK